jgi:hypothetical protein
LPKDFRSKRLPGGTRRVNLFAMISPLADRPIFPVPVAAKMSFNHARGLLSRKISLPRIFSFIFQQEISRPLKTLKHDETY